MNLLAQDSLNVRLVGSYDTPGSASDVAVSGYYAYLADGYLCWHCPGYLLIFDISIPFLPIQVGSYSTLVEGVWDVAVSSNYAYVVAEVDIPGFLQIIDISNPDSTFGVGFYNSPDWLWDVAVYGNYAYLAASDSGLRIIDISNPTSPSEVGYYDTPGWALGVAVSGNFAYVADLYSGLRIINISNPDSTFEVGFYHTPGTAEGVVVLDTFAYVADGDSGLRIVNISNPASPSGVGFYDTPGHTRGAAVSGNYAFVADGSNGGLRVIDISTASSPFEVGFYNTPGSTQGVAVSGGYIYVADGETGLLVFELYGLGVEEEENEQFNPESSSGQNAKLFQNRPNPFHSFTTIRYALPSNLPVHLAIYDITGRLIETLVNESQESGVYQVQWHSNPNRARSGIYFYRLTTGDVTLTRKMILLK